MVSTINEGAHIIIAQGRDVGGHSGVTRGTMGLAPAVVDAVAPGRGLAAALALGAAGVSMGTRFTASRELLWDSGNESGDLGG